MTSGKQASGDFTWEYPKFYNLKLANGSSTQLANGSQTPLSFSKSDMIQSNVLYLVLNSAIAETTCKAFLC